MKNIRIFLFIALLPVVLSFSAHKFYVSITRIEYAEEQESLQIISKLFIDDIEDVLQERYSSTVSLDKEKETAADAAYLKEYVLQKLRVQVDGEEVSLEYLGHEYENDVVKTYLEIKGVTDFQSVGVENKMLMELFVEQQNIIHVKRFKKRKSLILDRDNPKGLLNFD